MPDTPNASPHIQIQAQTSRIQVQKSRIQVKTSRIQVQTSTIQAQTPHTHIHLYKPICQFIEALHIIQMCSNMIVYFLAYVAKLLASRGGLDKAHLDTNTYRYSFMHVYGHIWDTCIHLFPLCLLSSAALAIMLTNTWSKAERIDMTWVQLKIDEEFRQWDDEPAKLVGDLCLCCQWAPKSIDHKE